MRNLILAVTVALVVSACATTRGAPITQAQLSQIVQGQTTKAELAALFGVPLVTTANSDGSEVLSWGYSHVDPLNGLMKSRGLSVILDESGMVKSYSVADYGGM